MWTDIVTAILVAVIIAWIWGIFGTDDFDFSETDHIDPPT